jgi:hypothetical protein
MSLGPYGYRRCRNCQQAEDDRKDIAVNSLLSRLRITARLYGSFGPRVAIGFAVAVISVWQFGTIKTA